MSDTKKPSSMSEDGKSFTITLNKQLMVNGEAQEKLVMRSDITLDDLIAVEDVNGGNHAMTKALIARLSGWSTEEVGKLSIADYRKADRKLSPFFDDASAAPEESPSS